MKLIFRYLLILGLFALVSTGRASLFYDDFSADTRSDYEQFWNNGTFNHNTTAESLEYSRSGGGWQSDAYLVKTNTFSLTGLDVFTVKTEITFNEEISGSQAGLLFAAGNGVGGFLLYRFAATPGNWRIRTIADNLSDGSGDANIIGDFDGLGTYTLTATVDRSGDDAIISGQIDGPDTTLSFEQTFVGEAGYGGEQVGFWIRNSTDAPEQSFDYLEVIPEPSSIVLLAVGTLGLWIMRRRF